MSDYLARAKLALRKRLNLENFIYISLQLDYWLCGYPRYSASDLGPEVYDVKNVPPQELVYFRTFSTEFHPILMLGCLVCALISVKNLIFPLYTMISIHTIEYLYIYQHDPSFNWSGDEVEHSMQNSTNGKRTISIYAQPNSHLTRFGCLRTNCTKLSGDAEFITDLKSLPVFKLCYPNLQAYYYPVLDTNSTGLMVFGVTMCFCIILGLILPLSMFFKIPLNHEYCMFILAPTTIHRYHGQTVRRYLIDRLFSMKNYYFEWRHTANYLNKSYIERKSNNVIANLRRRAIEKESFLNSENLQLNQLNQDYNDLNENARAYVDDCAPLIRNECFATLMAKHFFVSLITIGLYLTLWAAISIWYMHKTTVDHEQYLAQIDRYVSSAGCAIWRNSGTDQIHVVKVSEPHNDWTLFTLLNYLVQCLPFALILCINISLAICVIEEIDIQLAEQMDRFELALEMNEILYRNGQEHTKTEGFHFGSETSECSLKRMRQIYMNRLSLDIWGQRFLRKSRQITRVKTNSIHLTGHLIGADQVNLITVDSYLDVLIKTYISNRVLVNLIKKDSYNLSYVMLFSHILNITTVLIVLYFNRSFGGQDYASITYASLEFILTSVLISHASHIQARSRRMMAQIWQLIAASWRFDDLRIRHMRCLLTRQVIFLDHEAGLTIRAFNVPVTYKNVIGITFWFSTLILLVFRH